MRPNFYMNYNSSFSYADRVKLAISLLKTTSPAPYDLVMLYFESPNDEGHLYGPETQQVFIIIKLSSWAA